MNIDSLAEQENSMDGCLSIAAPEPNVNLMSFDSYACSISCPPFILPTHRWIRDFWSESPFTPCQHHLAHLPNDVFDEILRLLDLAAVISLRRTSKPIRRMIHQSFPFKHILLAATRALIAFELTELASYVTVQQLFDELTYEKCRFCSDFGPYISLLECKRCCLECKCYHPFLQPVTAAEAENMLGIDSRDLKKSSIPRMLSLPGKYAAGSEHTKRYRLSSLFDVFELALKIHGGQAGLDQFFHSNTRAKSLYDDRWPNYGVRKMSTALFPLYDSHGVIEKGRNCLGCYLARNWVCRPVHVVSERDYAAQAHYEDLDRHVNKICGISYTYSGMSEHFRECHDAQVVWKLFVDAGVISEEDFRGCSICKPHNVLAIPRKWGVHDLVKEWENWPCPDYPSGCFLCTPMSVGFISPPDDWSLQNFLSDFPGGYLHRLDGVPLFLSQDFLVT